MDIRTVEAEDYESGQIIDWLLAGDPAVRWQTLRDLSGADRSTVESERNRIAVEGWGARLLALQQSDGMWAGGINYFRSYEYSETCVTGMILSILAHFRFDDERVGRLILHLLEQQMLWR